MQKKSKKLTVKELRQAIASQEENTKTISWCGLNLKINHCISLENMFEFVDSVVKSCFNDEDNSFLPEAKDFAIRVYTVEFYSNISLPSSVQEKYNILYRTDLVNTIKDNIDDAQFHSILQSINEKISYIAQTNIEMITKQVNNLYESLNNLSEQFENIYKGVDETSLNKVINILGNGGFDEDKLVEAIISHSTKEPKSGD